MGSHFNLFITRAALNKLRDAVYTTTAATRTTIKTTTTTTTTTTSTTPSSITSPSPVFTTTPTAAPTPPSTTAYTTTWKPRTTQPTLKPTTATTTPAPAASATSSRMEFPLGMFELLILMHVFFIFNIVCDCKAERIECHSNYFGIIIAFIVSLTIASVTSVVVLYSAAYRRIK